MSKYLDAESFQRVLKTYGLDDDSGFGRSLGEEAQTEVLSEVDAEVESALASRYVVPLRSVSGPYETTPSHTKTKISIAAKAMVRIILHRDYKVSSEDFANGFEAHQRKVFDNHMKDLLNTKKLFGLKMADYAEEAHVPNITVGLARPKSETEVF